MAMSVAAVNNAIAWIVLVLALAGTGFPIHHLWVLLSATAFLVFVAIYVKTGFQLDG